MYNGATTSTGFTTVSAVFGSNQAVIYSRNREGQWPGGYHRHVSRRERELDEALAKFKGDIGKLEGRLRQQEATRKAAADAASRARKPHPSTGQGKHRRLQTVLGAMDVLRASRERR